MRRCFLLPAETGKNSATVLAEQQNQDNNEDDGADADIHSESFFLLRGVESTIGWPIRINSRTSADISVGASFQTFHAAIAYKEMRSSGSGPRGIINCIVAGFSMRLGMAATQQWTVERYKSFEFWLSDPHRVGLKPSQKKWQCELRIICLNAKADEQGIVVRTIYPFTAGDTREAIYASAFVESLRICDQILDRPKSV